MATANENTTAPEASVVEDDRPTLEREDRSDNREDRSMRVHDRSILEGGHQSVHTRDRSIFRLEGLPVVLGNTLLEIEN